jgi:hypothetical protein
LGFLFALFASLKAAKTEKLSTTTLNRCYLFAALPFRFFFLSFSFCPILLAFRRILRAEQNPKTKPKKAPKKEAKQSREKPKNRTAKDRAENYVKCS